MNNKDFYTTKEILNNIFSKDIYRKHFSLFRIKSTWNKNVDKKISKYTKPYKIEKNILYVYVDNSILVSELNFKKFNILNFLKKDFDIIDIKFKIKKVSK